MLNEKVPVTARKMSKVNRLEGKLLWKISAGLFFLAFL